MERQRESIRLFKSFHRSFPRILRFYSTNGCSCSQRWNNQTFIALAPPSAYSDRLRFFAAPKDKSRKIARYWMFWSSESHGSIDWLWFCPSALHLESIRWLRIYLPTSTDVFRVNIQILVGAQPLLINFPYNAQLKRLTIFRYWL
jgi:hypothetical protein